MLDQCGEYIKITIQLMKKLFPSSSSIGERLKRLKMVSILHMQYCAILSQQNMHEEAVFYAKTSAKFAQILISQLHQACTSYVHKFNLHKNNDIVSEEISITSPVSLIDICSMKLMPIINELMKRISNKGYENKQSDSDLDMRSMLGYLDMHDWTTSLNISSMMQVSSLTMQDILAGSSKDTELSREAVLEKIALLATSYFCTATETRFLHQENSLSFDKISQYKLKEPSKERYIA